MGKIWTHPTRRNPDSVIVVALGPTRQGYFNDQSRHDPLIEADETWAINVGLRLGRYDLVFVMDDLLQFGIQHKKYGLDLRGANIPIITSTRYATYPKSVAYPLREVVETYGRVNAYFHNSIPYVLAYALFIGVKHMILFGADYHHEATKAREEDRANAEYWVGFCRHAGMRIEVVQGTTLLNTHKQPHFYGYLYQPVFDEDGLLELPAERLQERVSR